MSQRAAASEPADGLTADSAAVFTEFHRRLRAFVSRRVRNAADADDVVQETFLRIHRHLAGVREAGGLAAWVFRVARSAMVDHYRRHRRSGEPLDDHDEAMDPGQAGDEPARELGELAGCLMPLIESLPPADREAIVLADIDGVTQREASTRAGVSLSGMKSRVQRARRKLKAKLLECCHVELDRRGGVIEHEPRDGACGPCGSQPSPRSRTGRPC